MNPIKTKTILRCSLKLGVGMGLGYFLGGGFVLLVGSTILNDLTSKLEWVQSLNPGMFGYTSLTFIFGVIFSLGLAWYFGFYIVFWFMEKLGLLKEINETFRIPGGC